MRISTAWGFQQSTDAIVSQQSQLQETQMKISSGKKYLTPSENPTAATDLLSLSEDSSRQQQYQTNIGVIQQRLELSSSNITNAIGLVQSAKDLTIQGLSAGVNASNRQQIADQLDQLNSNLLSIANTKNSNGEYIYSGTLSQTPAFSSAANGFAYQGDANYRSIQISDGRQMTDGNPGTDVFGETQTGSLTQGNITNVMQAIQQISTDMRNNAPVNASLSDLDNALNRMDTAQATVGGRLNSLNDQKGMNDKRLLNNAQQSSNIGDVDMVKALSDMNQQQLAFQAAEQSYVQIKKLSLFNYL